jgi:hypothetical protein
MPDRYDPKLSVRPPGERRPPSASSEDDPLVELARLVTGRSPFDPAASGKNKPVPLTPLHAPDPTTDLESELLSDLQASFAQIREQVAAPAPAARPAQPVSAPARPAAAAPPATAARPAPPPAARPAPPRAAPPPAAETEADADELPPLPLRPAAAERPAERSARPDPAARPQPAAKAPAVPPVRANETPSFFRPPRAPLPARGDVGTASLRPTTAPASPPKPVPAEPTVRPPLASRWARPETPRAAAPAAESARPPALRAPVRPAPEPEYEPYGDEEALYDEAAAYADEAPVDQEAAYEDDLVLEDPDSAGFGQEDELPPFPEDELAEAGSRRSRRAMALIGGVLGIAVIGGGGYLLWQGGSLSDSPPPIIAADATPTKVAPAETPPAADADPQAKLIYDRVDDPNAAGNDTVLVTPGEDPIADIPAIPEEDAGNPISRVIIPGGPGIDGPVGDAAAADAATAESATPPAESAAGDADPTATAIGPRKVRTVVVRPDGTIVSSEATPAADAAATGDTAAAAPAGSADDIQIPPARTDMDAVLEGDSVAVNTDPLAAGDTAAAAAPGTVPAEDAGPAAPAADAAAAAPADAVPAASEDFPDPTAAATPNPAPPAAPAKPATPPKGTIVATTGTADGPIDLTPAAPAKPSATVSGSGVLVQVSSQKSEEAARSTFRDLQARYPGILGAYQADIQRADLGDRGIYYRVRVGPFSGADAQRLCDNLKAAGGDCIIAR